ncbi:unnamed protein product [Microthlaspi erraticum]|uniref:DUF7787 domain-containing protein n=1 Tax=Microthlaspi erraticum TaxID=1685480 RepID=A0A6D2KT39_9BRAS|nr:unnamed protein product [Microthlaspi erraticum]
MTRLKLGGEKKISLEEYVDFFVSDKSIDFTISYLNQIIHMHGFRKLHKTNKRTVGEAVDALDLLDLSRSTLKQIAVSPPSASPTLDEVITDIETLKWQECCLTSLEIINSGGLTPAVAKPKRKSSKRKKATKKKSQQKLGDADCVGDENQTIMVMALKRRKKKSIRSVNEAAKSTCILTTP